MIKEMLKSITPNKVDDDQISGLKIMLEHETFKEYHPLIQQKLDEIEAKKKEGVEIVVGAFKLEAGKFYITINNSIVYCLGLAMEDSTIHRLVVIEGGFKDPDLPGNLALQMFGDMRRFGCYASDELGRSVAALDNPKYAMHIIRQVDAAFKII
jgi:hypothetical protein